MGDSRARSLKVSFCGLEERARESFLGLLSPPTMSSDQSNINRVLQTENLETPSALRRDACYALRLLHATFKLTLDFTGVSAGADPNPGQGLGMAPSAVGAPCPVRLVFRSSLRGSEASSPGVSPDPLTLLCCALIPLFRGCFLARTF